jgi:predicted amidohydrolase
MAIALTYLERWDGAPRNSVSLIDRHGEIVMTYAKVHTCDFDKEAVCTPGDDFYVCTLDTDGGDVKIGELILTPNACTLKHHRIGQFRARAFENMVGVAMTNYAAPQANGHSVAFDAVAFDKNGDSVESLIIEAGASEGVYLAEFDLDEIRAYREREVWGNGFRKPHCYGLLTSLEVKEPFVRAKARS